MEIPRPGDRASFDVANLDGSPATITLTRGEERQVRGVSGIWGTEIPVHIAYEQTRPESLGAIRGYPPGDWGVQFGESSVGRDARAVMADPALPGLGRAPMNETLDGWLAVQVPVARANEVIKLVYSPEVPSRLNAAGQAIVVRQPGVSPAVQPMADDTFIDQPGEVFIGPALDPVGEWGTVTIERGVDLGGYRTVARAYLDPGADPATLYFQNDPNVFYVEVFVSYRPVRTPAGDFGIDDWTLVTGGGTVPALGWTDIPLVTAANVHTPLGTYPGAIDVFSSAAGGWLVFAVDRTADAPLMLRYQPPATPQAAWEVAIRGAVPPPAPVDFVIPQTPPPYIDVGSTISVADDARASALFEDVDTCMNPVAGYTVSFPESWYTNTAIGAVPACSWFSPTFYEVDDPTAIPDEIAIALFHNEHVEGIAWSGQGLFEEELQVDGRPARRREEVGVGGMMPTPGWAYHRFGPGWLPLGSRGYAYLVAPTGHFPQGRGPSGVPVLWATTAWLIEQDPEVYETNRAVLDRIMASLRFEER